MQQTIIGDSEMSEAEAENESATDLNGDGHADNAGKRSSSCKSGYRNGDRYGQDLCLYQDDV